MACLNTLKLEIKTLEQVFPKNHERFQIMSASVDELTCRFVGRNGKKYEIHANITVSSVINSIVLNIFVNLVGLYKFIDYLSSGQRVVVYEGRAVNKRFTEVNLHFPVATTRLSRFSVNYLQNI